MFNSIFYTIGDLIKALFVDFGSFIIECFRTFIDILALSVKTSDLFKNILLYLPLEFKSILLSFIGLLFAILVVKIVVLLKGLT